jgi:hypothetical protein
MAFNFVSVWTIDNSLPAGAASITQAQDKYAGPARILTGFGSGSYPTTTQIPSQDTFAARNRKLDILTTRFAISPVPGQVILSQDSYVSNNRRFAAFAG